MAAAFACGPREPPKQAGDHGPPDPMTESSGNAYSSSKPGIAPADTGMAPPSGPLSLFRAKLEGSAFTESPILVVKIVDGAAVWVP